MPKADLLIELVKSGTSINKQEFHRAVEAIIAEERAKKHFLLAERLNKILNNKPKNSNSQNNYRPFYQEEELKDFLFCQEVERSFEDLILEESILELCKELVEEHQRTDLLKTYNLNPRNRILLVGAPGNGKTSLAEAIAYELCCPLFVARYENLIGSFLGETANRLSKVFDYIKTQRCVLFFDEFDTIGKERGDTKETGEIKRVVSSLLLQIDKLPSYVTIITASNHSELLDKAVWRRFQLRLELKSPTQKQINQFIKKFEKNTNFSLMGNYDMLKKSLSSYNFSEIEEFLLDILRQSILKGKQDNPKTIISTKLKQWQKKVSLSSKKISPLTKK